MPIGTHSDSPQEIAVLVQRLLAAYQEVLALAARRTSWFWLLPQRIWHGPELRTPRFRVLVPQFAAVHAARTTRQLRRSLHAAAVDAGDETLYTREVELLERFERSLPSVPTRTLGSLLVLGALALSYGTGRLLGGSTTDLRPLRHLIGGVFTLDRSGSVRALEEYHWQAHPIYFTAVGLTVAIWVLLILPITSFRLKRALFNVAPGITGGIDALAGADARAGRDGIYALERDLFGRLDAHPPREIRFDLVLETALLALVAIVGVSLAVSVGIGSLAVNLAHPGNRHAAQVLAAWTLVFVTLVRLRGIVLVGRGRVRARPARAEATARVAAPASVPADWRRRAGAWLLDGTFGYLLWFVAIGVTLAVAPDLGSTAQNAVVYVSFVLVWALYVGASWLYGRDGFATPGKRLLKLRVVDADGARPSLRRVLVRELVVKGVLYWPFLLASAVAAATGKPPVHDRWLGLSVVRLAPAPAPEAAAVPALV